MLLGKQCWRIVLPSSSGLSSPRKLTLVELLCPVDERTVLSKTSRNATCSPKRRELLTRVHIADAFTILACHGDMTEHWRKSDVEVSGSGLLQITLQALSVKKLSKSTKRRPISHGSRDVQAKSADYDREVGRPRPPYAILSEWPVAMKPCRSTSLCRRPDDAT